MDKTTGTSVLFFIVMTALIVIALDGIKVETSTAYSVSHARSLIRECHRKHKTARVSETIWEGSVPMRWEVSCGPE